MRPRHRTAAVMLTLAGLSSWSAHARAQEPAAEPVQAQTPTANGAANDDLAKTLDAARKPSRDTEARAVLGLEIDHAFLRLYDMPLQTTGARLGIGVQNNEIGALVIADYGIGSLGTAGLHTSTGSLGFEVLYRALSFVRLGGGARLGYLSVSRVTNQSPMEALGIGAFLSAKVDVYDFGPRDDHGAYLGGRIDMDTYQGNGQGGPFIWGPQLFAGFRY